MTALRHRHLRLVHSTDEKREGPAGVRRYRAMDDGRLYRGRSAAQVIDGLRRMSFAPQHSRPAFMRHMARRYLRWNGAALDTTSCEAFVSSLVRQGFLVEV